MHARPSSINSRKVVYEGAILYTKNSTVNV